MKVKFYIQCLNIIISKPQEITAVKFDNILLYLVPSVFNDIRKKTGNFTYQFQTFLSLYRKIHHKFFSFRAETSSLPAPAILHDHIYLPAVFNFMDDVYSRRPQDLSNFSHPHKILLVGG